MKKSNWKELAELVGLTAIVASLIFVGLQLKQSHDIAIASQYHDRAALAVEFLNGQLESGNLDVWSQFSSMQPTPEFPAEAVGTHILTGAVYLTIVDNHYYQYQSGFLEEEVWQAHQDLLEQLLNDPATPAAAAFRDSIGVLSPEFRQLCESLVE